MVTSATLSPCHRSSLLLSGREPRCNTMSKSNQAYQFKVKLLGIEPTIWRRIQVPESYSFWDLHVAIQDSMGWLDYHLHMFRVREREGGGTLEIGIPNDEPFEDEPRIIPGWKVAIADYFLETGETVDYLYDFGDDWQHAVTLEDMVDRAPRTLYPKCVAGSRACPPEDCGGIGGYENVLHIIADPSDEEHASMMEWLGGGYDPEAFEPQQVRFDNPKNRWDIAFAEE